MSKKPVRGRRSTPAPRSEDSPLEAPRRPGENVETVRELVPPRWDEIFFAVGLALFMILRTFWDGATYEYDNVYFLWAIVGLFAVWGVRSLFRGGTIRFTRLSLIFGLFLAIAALTGLGTVQADATIRALAIWTGHFLLFLLAANALRSRVAIGIVLGGFVLAVFGEILYSYVHYYYILPFVRRQMIENPSLLQTQFGATQLTPELAHRLNVKRASGSFLFANALGAYLVLCIPYLIGEAAHSFWRWRHELPEKAAAPPAANSGPDRLITPDVLPRLVAAGTGISFAFIVLAEVYYFYPRVQVMDHGTYSWTENKAATVFLLGVLPLLAGALPIVAIARLGIRRGWYAVQAIVLAGLVPAALLALWLSLSRGGILALILASAAGIGLLLMGRGAPLQGAKLPARVAAGIAILAVLVGGLHARDVAAQTPGPAQAAAPLPPPAQPGAPLPPGVPTQAAPPAPGLPKIVVEGVDVPLKDLASPATFRYRLAYWTIALRIIGAHFWTGVGLGNFQSLYPRFQALGEPPVRTAHNDYLQVFSETGVFGFLCFAAFWALFLYWGARRILREPVRGERYALLGLYTGILAFLLHSAVDFNFYNPGLAALEFAMAGLFLARSGDLSVSAVRRPAQKAALVVLLIAAALAAGSSVRVHRAYALSGDDKDVGSQLYLAETLLDPQTYRGGLPFRAAYSRLDDLVPERKDIESFGSIYVSKDPRTSSFRPVPPTETLPDEELLKAVVIIRNPTAAKPQVMAAARRQIDRLERSHSLYPHNPETAVFLYQWYDFISNRAVDDAARREALDAMVKWSAEAVERDPNGATFRGIYGDALLRRGMLETDPTKRLQYYGDAVEQYRMGTELYPISVDAWKRYAVGLEHYGVLLKEAGHAAQANRVARDLQAARAESARLNVPPA